MIRHQLRDGGVTRRLQAIGCALNPERVETVAVSLQPETQR